MLAVAATDTAAQFVLMTLALRQKGFIGKLRRKHDVVLPPNGRPALLFLFKEGLAHLAVSVVMNADASYPTRHPPISLSGTRSGRSPLSAVRGG